MSEPDFSLFFKELKIVETVKIYWYMKLLQICHLFFSLIFILIK